VNKKGRSRTPQGGGLRIGIKGEFSKYRVIEEGG